MEISASLVINDILMSLGEETLGDHLQEIRMALYANLCDYTFVKGDPGYEIIEECDVTYKLLRDYKNYLIISGKRSTTINQYMWEIKKLLLSTGKGAREITEKNINSYLAQGKIMKKWKDTTYNSKTRSLRAFFKWATEYEIIPKDPMARIHDVKAEFVMGFILSPEQREIFRSACLTEREVALVDFLYSTGGRISEILQINIEDVDFINRKVTIMGKGHKERDIMFSAAAKVHLLNYLESRTDDNPALFVSDRKPYKRLSDDGVRNILKTIQKRDQRLEGLQISPHTFRRTCGTDMLNRGAGAELVKEKLGHEKVDTTLKCYARMSRERLMDAERRYGVAG